MARLGRGFPIQHGLYPHLLPPVTVPGSVLVSQGTAPVVGRVVVRALDTANQSASSAAVLECDRTVNIAQGRTPFMNMPQPGKTFAASQAQTPTTGQVLAITEIAGNHQAAVASQPGHTVQASISTNATIARSLLRSIRASQSRALSLLRARSAPTVVALQAQSSTFSRQASRTILTAQVQTASTQATSAHFAVVILTPQGQPTALARALSRHLQAAQGQSVSLAGARFLEPSGIASTVRFGRPTVLLVGQSIFPAGIPSTVALGTPTVGQAATQFITPRGWAESEVFGIPTLSHTSPLVSPAGIPSSVAVGVPIILATAPGATVPRNVLIDRVTREAYPWPLNHATEDSVKTLGRRLTRSGISASGKLIQTRKVFLIRHPSHPGPMHLILHGSLLDRSQGQYQTFIRFFNECDDRTFDYIDASGDSYHVAIVQFDARRQISPSRVDGSYFTYSLEVEVIDVNQGAYQGYVV